MTTITVSEDVLIEFMDERLREIELRARLIKCDIKQECTLFDDTTAFAGDYRLSSFAHGDINKQVVYIGEELNKLHKILKESSIKSDG